MADADKNILVTPAVGSTSEPTIVFTGKDNNPVTLRVIDDGTLSFEGSSGQLFSVTDSLTGTIFSVNDISGIPSLEVEDNGTVSIAEFAGNVGVGTASPSTKLHVAGVATSEGNLVGSSGIYFTALTTTGINSSTNGENLNFYTRNLIPLSLNGTSAGSPAVNISSAHPSGNAEMLRVNISAATAKGEVIKGAASQTANLQEWQDSSGTVLASISAAGNLGLSGTVDGRDVAADGTKLDGIAAGAEANAVDSVNTQTGAVVLDADDISDTSTTNKFTTAANNTKLGHISVTQAVDLDAIETRVNQLDAAVVLQGSWDASAGSFPGSGSAQAGDSYIVSVAGTVDSVSFSVNDRLLAIVDNASTSTFASNWLKLDYTDQVLSVNSQTGSVVLDADDISDASTTNKFTTAADITKLAGIETGATADQTAADIRGLGFFDTSNDGAGSGLDADLLDGNHASAFATAAQGSTADSALQNVVEDTTPQLGGALDVNGQEITGAIDLHSTGDIVNELGDAAGVNKLSVRDSAAVEVASIDSDGNFSLSGTVDGRDVATDGTKLDGIAAGAEVNAVDSVNTQTGAVVLDADDISDTSTTNKFTTAADISKLAGIESGATADQTAADIRSLGFFDTTNDGTGSGLDADLLDGNHAAAFATAAQGSTADSALQNVVEDTTPQLGGALDVNGQEITGAIDLHSTGDIVNELGDAAGANKLSIRDSAAVEVASIDSDGNLALSGTVDGRDVATDGTKLDGIAAGAEVNAVDSVNSQTGAVVLDADDISDTSTTNKFTTAAEITKLAGIETGADVTDAANVETAIETITLTSVTGATGDEILVVDATDGGLKAVLWENLPAAPVDSVNSQTGAVVLDADDISDTSTTNKFTTAADISKLAGIESGATADQTAADIRGLGFFDTTNDGTGSGLDADLLDGNHATAFATAAQGSTADSALQNVVEDTTPQLGGALDVNGQEITGAIDLHSTGDVITELGDAAGVNKLSVRDSAAVEVAAFDSDGNLTLSGTVDGRDVAADGTKLDGIAAGAEVNTVDSVNSQTGAVVLDADDISDAGTTNKFTTAANLTKLGHITVTQAVDLDTIESRVNQLDAAVVLQGSWDASAGSFPGSGSAQAGDSYIVSVAGTVDSVAFSANDRLLAIVDNASTTTYASNWLKLDYTDQVLSVNTQTGAVVLDADDISDTSTTNKFTTAADITKLAGIETGATADQTAADIRGLGFFDTTNDGTGSGLDADLLDGNHATAFATAAQGSTADSALQNVIEDTTPQLGGSLDVNGQEITGAIDLHSTGDIINELGDAAGTNKLSIRDSAAVEVAAFDSDGNLTLAGTVDGRDVAADGTKLDGIESGATADQTAADIRGLGFFDTSNDGTGSGLDADLLDGNHASAFATAAQGSTADSALQNIVEDTAPQLGGALDVNGQEITGAIDLHSTGDIVNELGDAAGANKLSVRDSGAVEVAAFDSDGNLTLSGTVDGRDVATDGTKLDGIAAGAEVNAVDSVNSQTGAVVLDADDISDAATTNKFTTAADITKLAGIETGADVTDAANVETSIEAITLTSVSGATGDEVLIVDATDGGLKAVLWENLPGGGGGISNVVEDTTPQLGGALDVNGQEITGAIDLHSTGDVIIELGDAAGTNKVSVRDSGAVEQFLIDSDGNVGVGKTPNSGSRLDVNGRIEAYQNTLQTNNDDYAFITSGNFGGGYGFYEGTNRAVIVAPGGNQMEFFVGGSPTSWGTMAIDIDSSGNVKFPVSIQDSTGRDISDAVISTDVNDIVEISQSSYDALGSGRPADRLYLITS